jgi:hypothetical protein
MRTFGTRALTKNSKTLGNTKVFFPDECCRRHAHNQQVTRWVSALETQDHSLAQSLHVQRAGFPADYKY